MTQLLKKARHYAAILVLIVIALGVAFAPAKSPRVGDRAVHIILPPRTGPIPPTTAVVPIHSGNWLVSLSAQCVKPGAGTVQFVLVYKGVSGKQVHLVGVAAPLGLSSANNYVATVTQIYAQAGSPITYSTTVRKAGNPQYALQLHLTPLF